jgi:hypothetical protein
MKNSFALFAAVALIGGSSRGAPALGDKPPRWEYAELHVQRSIVMRPAVPALPGAGGAAANPAPPPTVTVRWATGDEEVQAESWEQLAEKFKAPAAKKDGTPTVHKLRVFNRLGADGWEVVEHTGTDGTVGTATWLFKRRQS